MNKFNIGLAMFRVSIHERRPMKISKLLHVALSIALCHCSLQDSGTSDSVKDRFANAPFVVMKLLPDSLNPSFASNPTRPNLHPPYWEKKNWHNFCVVVEIPELNQFSARLIAEASNPNKLNPQGEFHKYYLATLSIDSGFSGIKTECFRNSALYQILRMNDTLIFHARLDRHENGILWDSIPLNAYRILSETSLPEIDSFPVAFIPRESGTELSYRNWSVHEFRGESLNPDRDSIVASEEILTFLDYAMGVSDSIPELRCQHDSMVEIRYDARKRVAILDKPIDPAYPHSIPDSAWDNLPFGDWESGPHSERRCREEIFFPTDSSSVDYWEIFGRKRVARTKEIMVKSYYTSKWADGIGLVEEYFSAQMPPPLYSWGLVRRVRVLKLLNGTPKNEGAYDRAEEW